MMRTKIIMHKLCIKLKSRLYGKHDRKPSIKYSYMLHINNQTHQTSSPKVSNKIGLHLYSIIEFQTTV